MSGLMHKVKDALQGGHKDGMSPPLLLLINGAVESHILIL